MFLFCWSYLSRINVPKSNLFSPRLFINTKHTTLKYYLDIVFVVVVVSQDVNKGGSGFTNVKNVVKRLVKLVILKIKDFEKKNS